MKKLLIGLLALASVSAFAAQPSIKTLNPENTVSVQISGNSTSDCEAMFEVTNKQLQEAKKVIILSQSCHANGNRSASVASIKYLKY